MNGPPGESDLRALGAEELRSRFQNVTVEIVGCAVLFTARTPSSTSNGML